MTIKCEHCKDTGTTAGPAGPNAYPCPFCTGYPELGTLDEFLAKMRDRHADPKSEAQMPRCPKDSKP